MADENSAAVLNALKTAFGGVESSVHEVQAWSKGVSEELKELNKELHKLQTEVAYLKGFVAKLGTRGFNPPAPTVNAPKEDLPQPLMKKPAAKIPTNIEDARQQLRMGL